MKLKVKKLHPDATIPKYANPGDAASDLTCIDDGNWRLGYVEYRTGLAFEIPAGHVMLIFPRSSISTTPFSLSNAVGVIDSGYRGEVTCRFRYTDTIGRYSKGNRVAQFIILPYPTIECEETNELTPTQRGTGGYGSTGK
jgi:dUTP pyrophosphatase